jgi:hypothetical protein
MQGITSGQNNNGGGMVAFETAPNALGFDPTGAQYRASGMGDSDEDGSRGGSLGGASPSVFGGGIDIPLPAPPSGTVNPRHASGGSNSVSVSMPQHASLLNNDPGTSSSSRQRRRLNNQSPLIGTSQLVGSNVADLKNFAYGFGSQTNQNLNTQQVNHTGTASYSLSADADLSPAVDGEEHVGGMSELADVVGQLSLNENAEVRYHGR